MASASTLRRYGRAYVVATAVGLLLALLLVPVFGWTVAAVMLYSAVAVLVFTLPPVVLAARFRGLPTLGRVAVVLSGSVAWTALLVTAIDASRLGSIAASPAAIVAGGLLIGAIALAAGLGAKLEPSQPIGAASSPAGTFSLRRWLATVLLGIFLSVFILVFAEAFATEVLRSGSIVEAIYVGFVLAAWAIPSWLVVLFVPAVATAILAWRLRPVTPAAAGLTVALSLAAVIGIFFAALTWLPPTGGPDRTFRLTADVAALWLVVAVGSGLLSANRWSAAHRDMSRDATSSR